MHYVAVFVAIGMPEFCNWRICKLMLLQEFATHEEDCATTLLLKELRYHLVWFVNVKTNKKTGK